MPEQRILRTPQAARRPDPVSNSDPSPEVSPESVRTPSDSLLVVSLCPVCRRVRLGADRPCARRPAGGVGADSVARRPGRRRFRT